MRVCGLIISFFMTTLSFGQDAFQFLQEAKDASRAERLDQALSKVELGLMHYPEDHDLLAYGARILLWKKEYKLAEQRIGKLFINHPNDYEGLVLKTTALLWQERWQELRALCEEALKVYENDSFFQEKRLMALNELEEHQQVRKVYQSIQDKNERMKAIHFDSKLNSHQRIGTSYRYSHFTNSFSPWQIARIDYHNQGKNPWSVSGIYGNMFDSNGTMLEGNLYPRINQKIDAYVTASYSQATIFPRFRLGGELIGKVAKAEISAGARWMNFKASNLDLLIYTAGLGTYFSNYYANYKVYLTDIQGNRNNLTHTFLIRRFIGHRYHYVQLNFSEGTTPLQVNNLSEVTRLQAMSARFTYSNIFFDNYLITLSVGSQIEQYSSGDRNRIDGVIGISRIF